MRNWPFHTLLLALYGPVSLLAHNMYQVQPSDALRSIVLALLLGTVSLGAGRFLYTGWRRSGLFASSLVLIFFSYGHFYEWGKAAVPGADAIIRHRYLLPVLVGALLLFALHLRRVEGQTAHLTAATNLAAIALISVPGIQIATWWWSVRSDVVRPSSSGEACAGVSRSPDETPDIYYIILDGYAREDVLMNTYDYDNSWFLEELRGMGFYVAEASQSNYATTGLSLASSLNYGYLAGDYAEGSPIPLLDEPSIEASRARQLLECLGYTIVAFDSGYYWSGWRSADYFLSPAQQDEAILELSGLNAFEAFLVDTSLLRVALDLRANLPSFLQIDVSASSNEHRDRVLYALEHLEGGLPGLPSPKFVFVHIVSPHRPFLFDREGNYLELQQVFTFASYQERDGFIPESVGYPDQLHYVSNRMLTGLGNILEKSDRQAVIIVQGDHGTGGGRYDRMSILNAYYIPRSVRPPLYPSISPVNTFRVIFNTYFDTGMMLLEDKSFYSTYDDLTRFEFLPNPMAP